MATFEILDNCVPLFIFHEWKPTKNKPTKKRISQIILKKVFHIHVFGGFEASANAKMLAKMAKFEFI